jgi:hypothetical protein
MTSEWQPLSVRRGKREVEAPWEGIPPHLEYAVGKWLSNLFEQYYVERRGPEFIGTLASTCRIPLASGYDLSTQFFRAVAQDEDLYLDALDATLLASGGVTARGLESALRVAGSVWTVAENQLGLERRVPEATADAFARVVAVSDPSAEELRQAWGAAFGRDPDPSDAWDHAIKAVEALLIPIVVPNAQKANLGTVAGELKANPERWE